MFNVRHVADWRLIREQKQKNNENENDRRIPHRYRRGDKILLLNKQANKCTTSVLTSDRTKSSSFSLKKRECQDSERANFRTRQHQTSDAVPGIVRRPTGKQGNIERGAECNM